MAANGASFLMPESKQSKWYRERDKKIVDLFNDGAPVGYLADRFRLSDWTIGNILKKEAAKCVYGEGLESNFVEEQHCEA